MAGAFDWAAFVQKIYEAFDLKVNSMLYEAVMAAGDKVDDRFGYLDRFDFWDINKKAFEATLKAHSHILPCCTISIDAINPYTFGELFYCFEFACYISALLLGVNPFDQPGVEAYKQYMFKALGKTQK